MECDRARALAKSLSCDDDADESWLEFARALRANANAISAPSTLTFDDAHAVDRDRDSIAFAIYAFARASLRGLRGKMFAVERATRDARASRARRASSGSHAREFAVNVDVDDCGDAFDVDFPPLLDHSAKARSVRRNLATQMASNANANASSNASSSSSSNASSTATATANEGDFPVDASDMLTRMTLNDDSHGERTKPRRVAPTKVTLEVASASASASELETSANVASARRVEHRVMNDVAHARRIAPTMVSRLSDDEWGRGSSRAMSSSGAATPNARLRSVSTSPNASTSVSRTTFSITTGADERMFLSDDVKAPTPVALGRGVERLATLHAAALEAGFPLDLSPELAGLCQLLGVPRELEAEDEDFEESVHASVRVRTGGEAHAYACAVLSRAPTLTCALGEGMLETLAESSVLAAHAPALHAKVVRELGIARVASSECERAYDLGGRGGAKLYGFDVFDALAKEEAGVANRTNVRGGRVVSSAEERIIEHNRERTRDAFYAFLRSSTSRAQGLGQDASVATRARALIANTHPANIQWLADLFVARLSQSSAVGETDEELGKSITPARLSRLHERIVGSSNTSEQPSTSGRGAGAGAGRGRGGRSNRAVGRGRGDASSSSGATATDFAPTRGFGADSAKEMPSFAGLFPPALQPYVRFIETTDSHKFCVALKRSLIAALHAFDPNSVSMSDSKSSRDSPSAGQTERMLAAHAMGSFLGVLTFGVAAGSAATVFPTTACPVQGIDLIGTLDRATARGELVVSVPWVLAFVRFLMWDGESLQAPYYLETLAYLRAMAASPSLQPSAQGFNSVRMCLRAVLANGLSVAAPVTTAQANDWNADDIAAPPPPPLAVVPALPSTSSHTSRAYGDPLASWGSSWARLASANASAIANNPDAALESPSREEVRGEASNAPDLSRVGVDRRYVETVCPSFDRAIKTIRQRDETERVLQESLDRAKVSVHEEPTMETPPPPAGAPRRVQAQPQRLEPTSVVKPSAPTRAFGSFEPTSDLSPTFGAVSPSAAQQPTLVAAVAPDSKSSSATEIKHALQRAFLQSHPGLRRLVDFAVDAATLAAVDDATAAVTEGAVANAQASVQAAAAVAAAKVMNSAKKSADALSHATVEDAWTPEFERSVERAAMAATREVIAAVAAVAAEDAGARAAAAVAALSGAGAARDAKNTASSSAATRAACGIAADAASFAAGDRVRRTLPFELHARIASDARRLLRVALNHAKDATSTKDDGASTSYADDEPVAHAKQSSIEAEYATIAASAIASAFASASKWPAGSLLAECSSLRHVTTTCADALTLSRSISSVIDCIRKVLEQDAKFSRAHVSRKKPIMANGSDKLIPDSRPGEKLAATLASFSRAFIKLLLAAPQNALSKTTKEKFAEEGWGIARDDVCAGVTTTLVATFRAAAPALDLFAVLAPPDATNPWHRVYGELFAPELWLGALREFPESPFAQKRVELIFADVLVELPRRRFACRAFSTLIDEAGKHAGYAGYVLCIRTAIRFISAVCKKSTFDAEEASEMSAFAESLGERCVAVGERHLARRAQASARTSQCGSIYANIKTNAC